MKILLVNAFVAKGHVMLENNLEISAPYWYVLSYLYLVQQGAHTYRHARSSRTCISPSSSLFGGEETDSEYSLQTANLHTASLWKGLFPQAGRGIKKDRGLQQADSTLHHAQHRHQQKAL